jgi:DNA-binding MarR family transcriptional regulator
MGTHISAPVLLQDAAPRLVLDAVRRVVRVLRESSRAAEAQVGLSGAQLFVLSTLASSEALSLGEVAERTLTHQSTVSVVVRRLVERGLVERASATDDRRRLSLRATRAGRRLLQRAPLVAHGRLVEGVHRLPPSTQRTLARALGEWVAAMGLGGAPPAMFFESEPKKPAGRKRAPAPPVSR